MSLLDKYRQANESLARVEPELAAETARLEEELDLAYFREDLPRMFDKTLEGLKRVRDIVRNLRDFARLDEGDSKDLDLNAAVQSTLEILRYEINNKAIQLEADFQQLPPVQCHPGKINQVFLNLLVNAVQASEPGGVIQVRTRAEAGGAVVEVEDRGCGISDEHLPHIFEPFFTTKPVGKGMGLGLSISYGVIRDHGGSIEVDTEVGRGSIFRVRLPLQANRIT